MSFLSELADSDFVILAATTFASYACSELATLFCDTGHFVLYLRGEHTNGQYTNAMHMHVHAS